MKYTNISAYRFIDLEELSLIDLRIKLKNKALKLQIKGTILLSQEGINLYVAGKPLTIDLFKNFLNELKEFKNLTYKESLSDSIPFKRLLVKIKQELIPLGYPEVQPAKFTAPHLSPEEFKKWYEEERDMVVLDTRNDYEVDFGTFDKAIDLSIQHFRHFPAAIKALPDTIKEKPIVTFCTGGIRCEKAAAYLLQQGFKEVYQLDGGILNYFDKCGDAYYQGSCFVFDNRAAVNPKLEEIHTVDCKICGNSRNIDKKSSSALNCLECSN